MELIELNTETFYNNTGVKLSTRTNNGMSISHCIVKHENQPIGMITINLHPIKSLNNQMFMLYIRGLEILTNYRKKGFGKEVVKLLEEKIKKELPEIVKTIELEAKESEGFWSKCGFIPTGEISKEGNPRMVKYI